MELIIYLRNIFEIFEEILFFGIDTNLLLFIFVMIVFNFGVSLCRGEF